MTINPNKAGIIWLLLLFPYLGALPQQRNYSFEVKTQGGYVSPGKMPFWMRSNQFGSVPLDNASVSLIGSAAPEFFAIGRLLSNCNQSTQTKFLQPDGGCAIGLLASIWHEHGWRSGN